MSAKHTPGPWEVDHEILEWHRPHGVKALAVFKWSNGGGQPVAWVHPYLRHGDPTADARLIAAAPDLLAALKFALSEDSGFACPASTEAVMLAAIAKAEGSQS